MNPETPGNGPDSSSSILFKRKRGRPRKDQNENITRIANIISMRNQIPGKGNNSPDAARRENPAIQETDDMVGKPVSGVVEATFDAGYLLSVKIGNSEISLRGIVFKPGHYVPVSSENDVAPQIEMVNRSSVPIPPGFHAPVHGSYRRGRGRGRSRNESRLASFCDRGTMEPVLLEPANGSVEGRTVVDKGSSSRVESGGGSKNELGSENRDVEMRDSPPLSVEPLQSIRSDFSKSYGEGRAGKMTELLLAVQENVGDKQATVVQHRNTEHKQN